MIIKGSSYDNHRIIIWLIHLSLGSITWTKINEFSENFRMGGGSFPIRKISLRFFRKFWGGKNNEFSEKGGGSRQSEWISLQIFGPPEKSATLFSENRVGGGAQRPFGSFPKIHQIWYRSMPLTCMKARVVVKSWSCTLDWNIDS